MIIEWLLSIGSALLGWIASLLPTWNVPLWFTQVDEKVNGIIYVGQGLGAWIDMSTIGAVITAVFIAMGISFAAKLVLRVAAISHISGSS